MIYFIQEDNKRGYIKIGMTEGKITARLSMLQTSTPDKLKLIGIMEGDKQKEAEIHQRFEELRYRREWFRPNRTLLDFITTNATLSEYKCGNSSSKTKPMRSMRLSDRTWSQLERLIPLLQVNSRTRVIEILAERAIKNEYQ